jgi:hypothetical protein
MARDDDGETPWTRQLLLGVGALAAVALLIGGVMSAFALGAAKVSGIDDRSGARASASPSLVMPSGRPTTDVDAVPAPSSAAGSPSSSASSSSSSSGTPHPKQPKPISLLARQATVGPGERIDLTGVYPAAGGATLQVQRFEAGAWTDFPVTVPVRGGQFATYITTSRTGRTRFRVLDPASGKTSNVVRVTIG